LPPEILIVEKNRELHYFRKKPMIQKIGVGQLTDEAKASTGAR
jgi:hypothetical protein